MRRAALGLLLLAVALSPGAASANPTEDLEKAIAR
jgi:hypothetical protein